MRPAEGQTILMGKWMKFDFGILLGDNEIKAYRNVSLTGDEEGLIGYWRLDEDSGTCN